MRTLGLFSIEGLATYRQHLALLRLSVLPHFVMIGFGDFIFDRRFQEMSQPFLGDWQPLPEIWLACRNRTFLYLQPPIIRYEMLDCTMVGEEAKIRLCIKKKLNLRVKQEEIPDLN